MITKKIAHQEQFDFSTAFALMFCTFKQMYKVATDLENLKNMENLESSANLKNYLNVRENSGKFELYVEKPGKLRGKFFLNVT